MRTFYRGLFFEYNIHHNMKIEYINNQLCDVDRDIENFMNDLDEADPNKIDSKITDVLETSVFSITDVLETSVFSITDVLETSVFSIWDNIIGIKTIGGNCTVVFRKKVERNEDELDLEIKSIQCLKQNNWRRLTNIKFNSNDIELTWEIVLHDEETAIFYHLLYNRK